MGVGRTSKASFFNTIRPFAAPPKVGAIGEKQAISSEGEKTWYQSAHCTKCSEMTGISAKFMESLTGTVYIWLDQLNAVNILARFTFRELENLEVGS